MNDESPELIRSTLESTRSDFHTLMQSLAREDFKRTSLNPGWTNGEILAHMVFGFIILNALLPMARLWGRLPRESSRPFAWLLNALTGPFNWINGLGARGQGRVFNPVRLGKIFDNTISSLVEQVGWIKDEEWDRGMYYPTRWDPNFKEFMTLEDLFRYPVDHFNFHLGQISR